MTVILPMGRAASLTPLGRLFRACIHSLGFASALAALVLGGISGALADQAWPTRFYNPQPRAGDLILPMPCRGAMVFRPVETPAAGLLDDRRILIGGDDPGVAYAETPRYVHIAGGFTGAALQEVSDTREQAPVTEPAEIATRRLYYIGAYEVTALQVAALETARAEAERGAGVDCPAPGMRVTRPAIGLTRAEVGRLAETYSTWLQSQAVEHLPREDGFPGFVRLPSEAEWEFAARGGLAVSAAVFRERVYPMPQGMPAHVWFQGAQSANGRLQPTGLLAPNPLGLHDMLGNASEFVLDPFHLNRFGRLHGQPGGALIKGGSFRTPRASIRSAFRQELPPFVNGAPNRPDNVGFRLVIGVPSLTSLDRVDRIRAEVAALGDADPTGGPVRDTTADILAELGRVSLTVEDAGMQAALERIAVSVRTVAEARVAQTSRTARSLMRLGGFLGGSLRQKLLALSMRRTIRDAYQRADPDSPLARQAEARYQAVDRDVNDDWAAYVDTVITAAENFDAETLWAQHAVLAVELAGQDRVNSVSLARLFVEHAAAYRRQGTVDREAWLAALADR